MTTKRKYVEGLSAAPGENRYPQPAAENQQISMVEVGLVSGSDVNKDHILVFDFQLAPNEYGR
jgi:hypothetical protein